MGVDAHLLRAWQRAHEAARARPAAAAPPPPPALGRQTIDIAPALARRMRHHLALFGPGIGAPSLLAEFPDASYRACAIMAWSFRRELRDMLHSCDATACAWTVPGSVWAADVWKPVQPIEDIYPYVLDVRDLATGYMVESCALLHADAETVGGHLWRLYDIRSPPLVLKTDNGPEFVGDGAWQVSRDFGVEQLCSPPEMPSYNGSCEAGHGAMRFRAELLARRDGMPGRVRLNHLEGALTWTNDLVRPDTGSCPSRQFDSRAPFSQELRQQFQDAVDDERRIRMDELTVAAGEQRRTIVAEVDRMSRQAISAALKGCGYLITRRVPIRQGIPYAKA